jgi:hypothetical protein
MTSISFHSGNVHETPHEPAPSGGEHRGSGTTPGQTGSPHGGAASSTTTNRQTAGSTPPGITGSLRGTRPVGNDIRAASDSHGPGTRLMDGGLPDRYIAHPIGDLRSDTSNRGIFVDDRGQRYLQSGANWYGAARDKGSGTWRAVSHDEPGKPGIPVEQGSDGMWRVHAEAGLKGGGGTEADKARARVAVHSTRSNLDAKTAERDTKRAELNRARAEKDMADRQEATYRQKYGQAERDFEEASERRDFYKSKADETKQRNASRPAMSDEFARMVKEVEAQMAASNTGPRLPTFTHGDSEMRDAERNYDEWSRKFDTASREYDRAQYELGATTQEKERASRSVSSFENDVASLESEILRLKQQLAEQERERDRLEAP